jgi:hypothetical protein
MSEPRHEQCHAWPIVFSGSPALGQHEDQSAPNSSSQRQQQQPNSDRAALGFRLSIEEWFDPAVVISIAQSFVSIDRSRPSDSTSGVVVTCRRYLSIRPI